METTGVSYFRGLLKKNVEELQKQCKNWQDLSTDVSVPETVRDEIRTSIGLSNLLMNQKLKQFDGLIDDSEFHRGEKEITSLDLHGFWDMVYTEVEKIQKSFRNLEKCKLNEWVFVEESVNKVEPKKKPTIAKTGKGTVSSTNLSSAARQRLTEAKIKMRAQMVAKKREAAKIVPTITMETNGSGDGVSSSPMKQAIATIGNLKISNRKRGTSMNLSEEPIEADQKLMPRKSHRVEKENIVADPKTPVTSNPVTPNKRLKDVMPLQCVTRSAKKRMLAERNVKN